MYCDPKTMGCDEKRFMRVSYMNIDMGLYLKFSTLESGRPSGCSGLERSSWLENMKDEAKSSEKNSLMSDRNSEHPSGCLLNTDQSDEQNKMREVVETFADSNQMWIKEFTAVFEKMLENGYQAENKNSVLLSAPSRWMGFKCSCAGCAVDVS